MGRCAAWQMQWHENCSWEWAGPLYRGRVYQSETPQLTLPRGRPTAGYEGEHMRMRGAGRL